MSRTNVKSYFEDHAHNYASRHTEFYSSIMNQIKNIIMTKSNNNNNNAKFLDVGCGDGSFIEALVKAGINMDYFATDISFKMITMAKENLVGCNVKLFLADSFNVPIRQDIKFDIIHIDSVLHHVIERTRGKSTALIKKILEILVDKLSDNGILIVEEWYYSSYIIPTFTSFVVFYGLKLINFLKLDLSFTREIRPGLEVNILHPKQLVKILSTYGSISLLNKTPTEVPKMYKLFLMKESGHITYILEKKKEAVKKE
jgi:SAM-dependent methyltransferase